MIHLHARTRMWHAGSGQRTRYLRPHVLIRHLRSRLLHVNGSGFSGIKLKISTMALSQDRVGMHVEIRKKTVCVLGNDARWPVSISACLRGSSGSGGGNSSGGSACFLVTFLPCFLES